MLYERGQIDEATHGQTDMIYFLKLTNGVKNGNGINRNDTRGQGIPNE